ncbi:alpha/beta hydrolase [Lacticaseibacillus jixianensis]|uniref:Alpha/beta hydrolase n=1 Tax=Lacticaseibacillus jixianensis TaxID=2486012 RepID=A0ABW4B5Y4_9LACO|nr:alpha/beta fold hydrolase [Lacticaseibacillus jixianensis]
MALITLNRTSAVMMSQTLIKVALPDDIGPGEKLPTVWLLHGLGDDGTVWQRKVPVEQYAVDHHWAIVMPGFDRSFYMNMAYGSPYGDYLEKELLPAMRNLLPLAAAPAVNWLVGNSMGGYGALRLAFLHPRWFSAVAVMSAVADLNSVLPIMPDHEAVFGPDDQELPTAQLAALVANAERPAVHRLRFYQTVGADDGFRPANDALMKLLTTKYGLHIDYHVDPGTHSWRYWREHLPTVLDWLAAGRG